MRGWRSIVLGAALLSLAACRSGAAPSAPAGATMEELSVTSQSFGSRAAIPVDDSCDGADRSPQLTWSAPPPGTKSFAVVVEDPDASSGSFTQWIAYNLSADTRSLPEAADAATRGGASGLNDFKRPGYGGPCPPRLEIHHYAFRVFALNAQLDAGAEPNRDAMDAAMSGHVLAVGTLVGSFSH